VAWNSGNWDGSYWDGSYWDNATAGDGSATGQLAVTLDDVVLVATGTFTPAAGASQPGSTGPLRRKRWQAPTPRVGRMAVTLDDAVFTARGTSHPPQISGHIAATLDDAVFTARGVVRAPVRRAHLVATLDDAGLRIAATVERPGPVWFDRVDEDALALLLT
jgi:hypothetical protein